jgi:hypothetical protein
VTPTRRLPEQTCQRCAHRAALGRLTGLRWPRLQVLNMNTNNNTSKAMRGNANSSPNQGKMISSAKYIFAAPYQKQFARRKISLAQPSAGWPILGSKAFTLGFGVP